MILGRLLLIFLRESSCFLCCYSVKPKGGVPWENGISSLDDFMYEDDDYDGVSSHKNCHNDDDDHHCDWLSSYRHLWYEHDVTWLLLSAHLQNCAPHLSCLMCLTLIISFKVDSSWEIDTSIPNMMIIHSWMGSSSVFRENSSLLLLLFVVMSNSCDVSLLSSFCWKSSVVMIITSSSSYSSLMMRILMLMVMGNESNDAYRSEHQPCFNSLPPLSILSHHQRCDRILSSPFSYYTADHEEDDDDYYDDHQESKRDDYRWWLSWKSTDCDDEIRLSQLIHQERENWLLTSSVIKYGYLNHKLMCRNVIFK